MPQLRELMYEIIINIANHIEVLQIKLLQHGHIVEAWLVKVPDAVDVYHFSLLKNPAIVENIYELEMF